MAEEERYLPRRGDEEGDAADEHGGRHHEVDDTAGGRGLALFSVAVARCAFARRRRSAHKMSENSILTRYCDAQKSGRDSYRIAEGWLGGGNGCSAFGRGLCDGGGGMQAAGFPGNEEKRDGGGLVRRERVAGGWFLRCGEDEKEARALGAMCSYAKVQSSARVAAKTWYRYARMHIVYVTNKVQILMHSFTCGGSSDEHPGLTACLKQHVQLKLSPLDSFPAASTRIRGLATITGAG